MICINIVLKITDKCIKKDNEKAVEQLERNIRLNGYLEMKIADDEIYDLFTYQSVSAYIYIFIFQILLIIIKVVFPDND